MADDLDQLLDSALDDFKKIDLAAERRSNGSPSPPVQGLGLGLPDLKAKKKVKQRAAAPMKKGSSHAAEALEKLTQQTREAVHGLESATASAGTRGTDADEDEAAMVEEFVRKFEELTGSQDMESIMDTVMQQLLSKDILHEPMKEIGERYPKWLEEHKAGLNEEEYGRYQEQYKLILKLNETYEHEPNNFAKIVDLMQKMQECGQPPDDIVQELAPELDLRNFGGKLSPEMESSSNCCIM